MVGRLLPRWQQLRKSRNRPGAMTCPAFVQRSLSASASGVGQRAFTTCPQKVLSMWCSAGGAGGPSVSPADGRESWSCCFWPVMQLGRMFCWHGAGRAAENFYAVRSARQRHAYPTHAARLYWQGSKPQPCRPTPAPAKPLCFESKQGEQIGVFAMLSEESSNPLTPTSFL